MAFDEALLEAMPRLCKPVLRFYAWTEPAASFGYFQRFAEVERVTSLRPLVRRPTGGGIVLHDSDWTYSAVIPPGHPWYELRAAESYRQIHRWVQAGFARLGVHTELAAYARIGCIGQCFAGWERSDLLAGGRKIAGAAQRRTRHALLVQGSIQPPTAQLTRADWERAMIEVGAEQFGITWVVFEPDALLLARARELVGRKYDLPAYNRKR